MASSSAVSTQPLPYGRLERESHIRAIFRAFQNRCGPAPRDRCHHPPACRAPRASGGAEDGPGGSSDPLTLLDQVAEFHITARPQLQGPQCVPQRIYSVAAGAGRSQLFAVVEESSCVCLECCGPARACSLRGLDQQGRQLFYFRRPLRTDACCLGCCLMEMAAYTGRRQLIGTVCQRWSMFTPAFEAKDLQGRCAAGIRGPCCPIRCLSDQRFQIVSGVGDAIGSIWKKWPGFQAQRNMDHEYFGMEVPLDMDSQSKLLLLAATFLLNYMFFEMS